MDTASSQPGDLVLPLPAADRSTPDSVASKTRVGLPVALLQDLYRSASAADCALAIDEFSVALITIGEKFNYGLAPGLQPQPSQQAAFLHSLHLTEFALAQACALGREAAWQRFLTLYRSPITQAAIAITGSATLGHDLADSLYSELYGLREIDNQRRSPLTSYSGRGSLLGWLRTTLAQRHVDHHRRTRRETPLDTLDVPAPAPTPPPIPAALDQLTASVARTLRSLPPEDRYLLAAYFLDRQTLLQISRLLHVHEATVSRRLKRLTSDLRTQLLLNLQSSGLSKPAAEEALGTDPRDIEINLRALLQTSQTPTFPVQTESNLP